ncbi:uncharacterized protein PFL1_04491 [Pseudozyma flocculosa PF-1]|uniref:Uncharacterized protein n=1 Tax=Pseudozyma flocculosa PF-1 TaxID=1277687 RepID=A0A061H6S4_9BASI|nr:uncharacterized protein PFL1_04491 [Pseudozyma flocculosa PF-1]EPQ28164.1 hypothetical protein PFL1_04491 [Pseudozyma flocculosa PF-1]
MSSSNLPLLRSARCLSRMRRFSASLSSFSMRAFSSSGSRAPSPAAVATTRAVFWKRSALAMRMCVSDRVSAGVKASEPAMGPSASMTAALAWGTTRYDRLCAGRDEEPAPPMGIERRSAWLCDGGIMPCEDGPGPIWDCDCDCDWLGAALPAPRGPAVEPAWTRPASVCWVSASKGCVA